MAVVASETFTSTSAPIQYAAVRAFQGGSEIEQYLWQCRRILSALGNYIYDALKSSGVAVSRPDGAFYLFPDFTPFKEKLARRKVTSSAQLCNFVLEQTGVAILPGNSFGRPDEELTTRLAYVDFDGARALEAAEQVPKDKILDEEFLTIFTPNTIEGVDILVAWIHDYLWDV